jgi:hypothetical protein
MEYRSRRERREAERAGLAPAEVAPDSSPEEGHGEPTSSQTLANASEKRFPSRRELRMHPGIESVIEPSAEEKQPNSLHQANFDETVSPRSVIDSAEVDEELNSDIENLRQPLTGKSYIYQESSNTVTIDSIPDSLGPQTGDFVVTNSESIEVVTGSHSSMSAVMDDKKFDSEDLKDTVTGRISLVDPVSAKLVADSREPEVIVPGKIVVRSRAVSTTFAVLAGVMFILAGIGLWWALSEMGPFSS